MEHSPEEIQMMIYDKIAGTLPEQDDAHLMQMIAQDAFTAELWKKINNELSNAVGYEMQEKLPEKQLRVWQNVHRELTQGKTNNNVRGFRILKRMSAAAALLLVLLGAYFVFFQKPPVLPRLSQQQVSGKPFIELKLSGGEIIHLSDSNSNGSIKVGDVQLQNNNKTISVNGATSHNTGINSIIVPVGLDYKMVLSDGTKIWLNAATQIDFPFSFTGKTREISLQGEAYLQVAHDANKPFIVHLPGSSVQVLGTEFNINSYDSGDVKVSLVKGAIKMYSLHAERSITPGLEGRLDKSGQIFLREFDQNEVLCWMQGIHIFHDATVNEICTLIPRWFGVQVIVDNEKIRNERFSGFIDRNKPITFFLDNLKLTKTADYYFTGEILHLK